MAPPLNVDATAKLSVRDLVVRRAGRTVLDVPSLDVHAREVLAIIGPNGAGKTTLLLHLALLERPSHGDVLYDGQPARPRELALRRRMAVVFQEALLLDRSVEANVETGLRLRGIPQAERKARTQRWLTRFGVDALARRTSRALSGGEAQRVSLARAFALEPDVLLLDEPFSALDQPTRAAITDDLAAALRETHVTAIIVTHDHDEAARLGDRIAVLIDGRIRQIGTPATVIGAPADEDIAAFVGVGNIIPARVTATRDGLLTLTAGPHLIEAVSEGGFGQALVCLRPEDISISVGTEHLAGSARNKIPGRITRIIQSGADARVEIDCGIPLVARVTRRSLDELGLEPGASVVASFKATAVHLIPK